LLQQQSQQGVDKTMTVSKHSALAAELEKEIFSGRYGWEGGLPSVSDLAQKWNMSINTVKAALAVLEGKDIIEKRGIGYYVNRVPTTMTQYLPPAHARLQNGYCENIGTVKRVSLPEHLAKKLDYKSSELAVYRMQVSGEANGTGKKPLQITYRYHLLTLSDEQMQRMESEPTYDPMWKDAPIELFSHDEVTPRLATESERDLLNLPETTPINTVIEAIREQASNNLLMAQEVILSPRTTLIFDFPFTNKA
jgi:DNA-binding GntR family transcriptional regulator